jgi:23S rRNA (pseudouridine1915-N3)-methyltransferase
MPARVGIVAVGRLDLELRPAFEHYRRLLSRRVDVHLREVKEVSLRGRSPEEVKRVEGERLLGAVGAVGLVVALDEHGRRYDSVEFSRQLAAWMGAEAPTFVLGGAVGLSRAVLDRAGAVVSLSGMTFAHQLARIVLMEQIFRALKIEAGETYHH